MEGRARSAIKMAAVVLRLKDAGTFRVNVAATAQHREIPVPARRLIGYKLLFKAVSPSLHNYDKVYPFYEKA